MRKRWEDEPSGDGSDAAKGVLMAALTVEDAFALGLRPGERPDALRMERAFRAGLRPDPQPEVCSADQTAASESNVAR